MLSSALRRNRCNGSLNDLQKRLLNSLSGYISGNGRILRLSCDLVNLININNTMLCTFNIAICCLNHFQEDAFYIFPHISGLCQSCRICDGKRNIQYLCEGLGKQSLSASGRSKHQNITLLQIHAQIRTCHDPLVMIVYSNRKNLLCLVLSDYIFIKECLDLLWCQKIDIIKFSSVIIVFKLFFYNLRADLDTLITDISAVRPCDQLSHLRLRLITEGASYYIITCFSCHITLTSYCRHNINVWQLPHLLIHKLLLLLQT